MGDSSTLVDLLRSSEPAKNSGALNDGQAAPYLSHLAALPLKELLAEPTKLSSEAAVLTTSLTQLCLNEYPTFLSLHDTSSVLSSSFTSISDSLDTLLSSIPAIENEARDFASGTKQIQEERRKANVVLEQQEKLIDILEIPRLVDTCVRNGYYQEALDLSSHTKLLLRRFPDIPMIHDVALETEQGIRLMNVQLLSSLREPLKLPALFKAVNFLRRMKVFEEEELALIFLTSRYAYVAGLLGSVEGERHDSTKYLRRYIDIWREGIFDIATQFKTIFIEASDEEVPYALERLFSLSMHTALDSLLKTCGSILPRIDDPTSLTSILTQLSYCSSSFSRIGMDFRSLLAPLFENAVIHIIGTSVHEATSRLASQIAEAGKIRKHPSSWLLSEGAQVRRDIPQNSSSHVPPSHVTTYPPLAHYLNALITTLNNVRLLAPTSILEELLEIFDKSLGEVAQSLMEYSKLIVPGDPSEGRRSVDGKGQEREEEILFCAGRVYIRSIVPFLREGLVVRVYEASLEEVDAVYSSSILLRQMLDDWDGWMTSHLERRPGFE